MEDTINARQQTSQVKLLNGQNWCSYLYKQVCEKVLSNDTLSTVQV